MISKVIQEARLNPVEKKPAEEEKVVFSEQEIKRMNYKWLDQKAILESSLHIRVSEEIRRQALDKFIEEKKENFVQILK